MEGMETEPVLVPLADGEKVTSKEQVPLAERLALVQPSLLRLKSPLIDTVPMFKLPAPVFVTVTVRAELEAPTSYQPKLMLVALNPTAGDAAPVPS